MSSIKGNLFNDQRQNGTLRNTGFRYPLRQSIHDVPLMECVVKARFDAAHVSCETIAPAKLEMTTRSPRGKLSRVAERA